MTHRLILLRHGKRPLGTDELHSEGLIQASARATYFSSLLNEREVTFISSPKWRCVQTLQPIAEACGKKLRMDPALEERRPTEDARAFIARVENFVKSLSSPQNSGGFVFLCSHSDWVFEAAKLLVDVRLHLEEAGWCEFELQTEGKWTLTQLVAQERDFESLSQQLSNY